MYANRHLPFRLSVHYSKSHGKRALAFKYKVKSADQAICRGAFSDGLTFLQASATVAVAKAELRVLIDVINRAINDLQLILSPPSKGSSKKDRKFAKRLADISLCLDESDIIKRIMEYDALKIEVEASLTRMSHPSMADTVGTANAVSMASQKMSSAKFKKQLSSKLNWQPSYVASKFSVDDDDDDEDDEEKPTGDETEDNSSLKSAGCKPKKGASSPGSPGKQSMDKNRVSELDHAVKAEVRKKTTASSGCVLL